MSILNSLLPEVSNAKTSLSSPNLKFMQIYFIPVSESTDCCGFIETEISRLRNRERGVKFDSQFFVGLSSPLDVLPGLQMGPLPLCLCVVMPGRFLKCCCGTGVGKQKPQWEVLALPRRLTLRLGIGRNIPQLHTNTVPTVESLMILFPFAPLSSLLQLSVTLLSVPMQVLSDVSRDVQ